MKIRILAGVIAFIGLAAGTAYVQASVTSYPFWANFRADCIAFGCVALLAVLVVFALGAFE